tara:strand:- start:231 stop:377 length:147 start_codon:yes stop_codon:yes gene_type:complete
MRFTVSMINNLGKYYEDTFIANNEKEEKKNLQPLNPKHKILSANGVYN